MNLKNNQSGVAHIALIALVLVIAVVGFAGWRVWDNSDKSNSNSSAGRQSEASQATTDNTIDSTKNYVEIPQWGVEFEVPSTVLDLKVDSFNDYPADENHVASSTAYLNSPKLEAEGIVKTTGTQERREKLGNITRQESNSDYYPGTTIEKYAGDNKFAGKKIGDYYYVYITTDASENTDTYLNAIKTSIENSLKSTD